jgi:hypothetical protein
MSIIVLRDFFWQRIVYDFGLRKSGGEFVRSIYAIYFMKGQENHVPCCIGVAVPDRLISDICANFFGDRCRTRDKGIALRANVA